MIDHLRISVSDLERSKKFYEPALATLGYHLLLEHPISGVGFGRGRKPVFWVNQGRPSPGVHVAFVADDHDAIRDFHRAALAAGGRDHGGPGYRPEYHPAYYGAFVLDPDGHNIEAVCHTLAPAAGSAVQARGGKDE